MNEQLQNQLATILGSILNGVKQAGDFALVQLPDIAQQYVVYGRAKYTTLFLFFLIVIAGLAWGIRWAFKDKDTCDDVVAGVCIFGGLGIIGCSIGAVVTASEALLVWLAPKVWLIQELARLMK